jgi:hypothetical protein
LGNCLPHVSAKTCGVRKRGHECISACEEGTHFCADLSSSVSSRLRGGLSLVFRLDLLRMRTKRSATRWTADAALLLPCTLLSSLGRGILSNSMVPCICVSTSASKRKASFQVQGLKFCQRGAELRSSTSSEKSSPGTTAPGSRPPPCRTPARA